jgi:hypothetical protein
MWTEETLPGVLQRMMKPEAHLKLDGEERNPGARERRRNGVKQRYTTAA